MPFQFLLDDFADTVYICDVFVCSGLSLMTLRAFGPARVLGSYGKKQTTWPKYFLGIFRASQFAMRESTDGFSP